MITEPLTIPLSLHQRAKFARWQEELQRAQQQIATAQAVAIEMLVAAHVDPVEIQGATYEVTGAGLVLTPPAQSLKLEA